MPLQLSCAASWRIERTEMGATKQAIHQHRAKVASAKHASTVPPLQKAEKNMAGKVQAYQMKGPKGKA
jgi:hypothetical protein